MESLASWNRRALEWNSIDSLGLAVCRSIAGAIVFRQRVTDEVGIKLRDLQVIHLLQLHGRRSRASGMLGVCHDGRMTVVLDRLEKASYVVQHYRRLFR